MTATSNTQTGRLGNQTKLQAELNQNREPRGQDTNDADAKKQQQCLKKLWKAERRKILLAKEKLGGITIAQRKHGGQDIPTTKQNVANSVCGIRGILH